MERLRRPRPAPGRQPVERLETGVPGLRSRGVRSWLEVSGPASLRVPVVPQGGSGCSEVPTRRSRVPDPPVRWAYGLASSPVEPPRLHLAGVPGGLHRDDRGVRADGLLRPLRPARDAVGGDDPRDRGGEAHEPAQPVRLLGRARRWEPGTRTARARRPAPPRSTSAAPRRRTDPTCNGPASSLPRTRSTKRSRNNSLSGTPTRGCCPTARRLPSAACDVRPHRSDTATGIGYPEPKA